MRGGQLFHTQFEEERRASLNGDGLHRRRYLVLQRQMHQRARRGRGRPGYSYVHSAVDDHSRLAYSEVLDDETAQTAAAFWLRAEAFFRSHDITVAEGNSGSQVVNLPVTLGPAAGGTITLNWSVTAAGTASVGSDVLAPTSGVVSVLANATAASIPITIAGDAVVEPNEIGSGHSAKERTITS